MRYFYIIDTIVAQENVPDSESYKDGTWVELSLDQYNFAKDNPGASLQEIENMQMTQPDPLAVAKQNKLNELYFWAYTVVSAGWTDDITGYKLFCGESNVDDYAKIKNGLLDQADDYALEIGTMYGWIASTKAVIYPLLVRYSAYMIPFSTKYRKAITDIEDATTVEQIEAIVI